SYIHYLLEETPPFLLHHSRRHIYSSKAADNVLSSSRSSHTQQNRINVSHSHSFIIHQSQVTIIHMYVGRTYPDAHFPAPNNSIPIPSFHSKFVKVPSLLNLLL